ncbi:MAG: hypothetical protein JWL60_1408, partial [Gemmatimonadetes bacterium]|nr:hypothetical protein [Gemmatimonadota bacterium]
PARAQYADTTMFAVNATQNLYTTQRATGATALIGTLAFNTTAIARDPATGYIYYTSTNYAPALNGRVAYWNPASGTNTVVNGTGNGDNVVRLAFSTTGVLYGIGSTSPTTLYRIDPATGAFTSLGPVKVGTTTGADIGASGDLAIDFDGTLYATATAPGGGTALYRVSTAPSAGVYVATLQGQVATVTEAALAFGTDGGLFSAGANGTMYRINKATGAQLATVVTGGLAFYDFATLPRFADLSVTGTTAGLPRGGTATFNISVANGGPQFANGQITVVDSLPNGLTYAGVSGAGWTCAAVGRRVTCTTPGPLAAGATSSFALSATVASGATGTLNNIIRVQGSTIDPDPADNRVVVAGTTTINVVLGVTKSHAGTFTVGSNGVYTITARNNGTAASAGTVTFTDTLPAGLSWVSGTGTGFTCGNAGPNPRVVTCTYPGSIGVGITVTLTLTVGVAAAAAPGVTNRMYAAGGGQLTIAYDDDATVVNMRAVQVTPDALADPRLPSNGVSYTGNYTVTNSGTLGTTYSLAAARLPGTSTAITSVNGVNGTTGSVTLAPGASLVVPVVYTVADVAAGAVDTLRLTATATTSAAATDSGTLIVTVVRAALSMTKALYRADQSTLITSGDQVTPGDTVSFRVTVTSTGAAGSASVQVTDPLPSGVEFVAATGDAAGWTITENVGQITASLAAALPTGQSRWFWITVRVR